MKCREDFCEMSLRKVKDHSLISLVKIAHRSEAGVPMAYEMFVCGGSALRVETMQQ
jgi:hypothetical protein